MKRILIALLLAQPLAGEFRAAVAKVDITPQTPQWLLGYGPRKSTGVKDKLYHRVVVMNDGFTEHILASTDIALISPSVHDDFCRRYNADTIRFWWTTTHTHSAPEIGPPGLAQAFLPNRYEHSSDREYYEFVLRSLDEAIRKARAELRPARMLVGTGKSSANINRRALDADGKVKLGLNPDGPVDRQINLIRLDGVDGKPIALIANYAMHGTTLAGTFTEISADAPGMVSEYVESKTGAPMLYINGAAGNIAPLYTVFPERKFLYFTMYNVLLGDRILEANRTLKPVSPRFTATYDTFSSPRKPGLGWAPDIPSYVKDGNVQFPVNYWKLAPDVGIWAAPLEMFCEIAMDVRGQSPFKNTFFFGYTNGWMGYMPTKAAFAEGGYEPSVSAFTDAAPGELTRTALKGLKELKSAPSTLR